MYALLGSNGNITSRIAALLLARGNSVRVIGRNARALAGLEASGAQVVVGDIGNAGFLRAAFTDATAIYAMIPTDVAAADMGAAQDRLGEAIAHAVAAAGVSRLVNLSSIGAHLAYGTGPIAGLHRQEKRLDALERVDVLHIRPGYFFENHLAAIEMIRASGVYADMTAPNAPLPMVATTDIAQVITRELLATSHSHRVLHLRAPRLYTMRESTALLGAAIGIDLSYEQSEPELGKAALTQEGFSASAASLLEEMSEAFSNGRLNGEHEKGPTEITPTTLEQFAVTVFKPAYEASARLRAAS